MRYRRRRRSSNYLYRSFYRRPMTRVQRIAVFILVLLLLACAAVTVIFIRIRPLMYNLAKTIVTDVVMIEVNDVIEREVLKGTFDYTKLVTLDKDHNGDITALILNTAMINTLQTKISSGVFANVEDMLITDIEVPVGNAIGGMLLSGRGPKFKIKILSVADVETGFTDSFSEAGVNQTRHKIYLNITVFVDILVPGYKAQTLEVSNQVAVAETVIVGRVPNVYANIERP